MLLTSLLHAAAQVRGRLIPSRMAMGWGALPLCIVRAKVSANVGVASNRWARCCGASSILVGEKRTAYRAAALANAAPEPSALICEICGDAVAVAFAVTVAVAASDEVAVAIRTRHASDGPAAHER